MSSPPAPLPLRTSPPPCPMPPLLSPFPPLIQYPPAPTTSEKPSLPASKQISHRGPESFASQYIVRPYSASFYVYPDLFKTHLIHCFRQRMILPPPYPSLLGLLPVILRATLFWKLPRFRSIRGARIHVFDPKSNTAWTTALKTNRVSSGLPSPGPGYLSSTSNSPNRFLG